MSIKFKTGINSVTLEKWEGFLASHPDGNIFQSPYFYRIHAESQKDEPLAAFLFDGDEIVGVMLGIVQSFAKGLARRAIISSGPLVVNNDPQLIQMFLQEYETYAQNNTIYSEIRNGFDTSIANEVYLSAGYEFAEHLNILIDLSKSEEELWQEVHSKRRNEIRRASREGTSFSQVSDEKSLSECYEILQAVYDRANLPLPRKRLFLSALRCSTADCGLRIFVAQYNDKIVGTMIALAFKNVLFDWYAGSYREFYNKYPNDLIPWEVFLWGRENGYHFFDFGGAGKPGVPYGVRDYKKKFGGEFVNFGRYKRIHQPVRMRLAEAGFMAWQQLKSRRKRPGL